MFIINNLDVHFTSSGRAVVMTHTQANQVKIIVGETGS